MLSSKIRMISQVKKQSSKETMLKKIQEEKQQGVKYMKTGKLSASDFNGLLKLDDD